MGWVERDDVTLSRHRFRIEVARTRPHADASNGDDRRADRPGGHRPRRPAPPGARLFIKDLVASRPTPRALRRATPTGCPGRPTTSAAFAGGRGVVASTAPTTPPPWASTSPRRGRRRPDGADQLVDTIGLPWAPRSRCHRLRHGGRPPAEAPSAVRFHARPAGPIARSSPVSQVDDGLGDLASAPLRSWRPPSIQTWVTGPGMAAVCGLQLVGGAERVAGAGDEQARDLELGEVVDAQLVGPARRVQRVGDQQPGPRRAGPRPPPSSTCGRPWTGRPAPAGRVDAGLGGQRRRLLPHAGDQLGGAVGRPPALAAVGEVGADHRQRRRAPSIATRAWSRPRPPRGTAAAVRPRAPRRRAKQQPRPAGRQPASRMRRASLSSARRSAAAARSPPWSGWAARTRSRNRRWTALRPGAPLPSARGRARRAPSATRVAVGVGRPVVVPGQAGQVATSAPSIGPDQRMPLRMASITRVRGPGGQRTGGVDGGRMCWAGEPLSSISNARSSPSPRRRWTLRCRPTRSVWRRWRRRGWGMRVPASSWRDQPVEVVEQVGVQRRGCGRPRCRRAGCRRTRAPASPAGRGPQRHPAGRRDGPRVEDLQLGQDHGAA